MKDKLRWLFTYREARVLGVFLVLYFGINLAWISLNQSPLPWDQANHVQSIVRFTQSSVSEYLTVSSYYPPLIYLISLPMFILSGGNARLIQLVGTFSLMGLAVVVYVFTQREFKNRQIALLSAILLTVFPIMVNQSKWLLLDIPLALMLWLSFLFLRRSDHFTNRNYALLFGIFAALVLLTKWSGIVFLGIAILYELSGLLLRYRRNQIQTSQVKQAIVSLVVISLVVMLLAGPWYAANLETLIGTLRIWAKGEMATDPVNIWSLSNFLFYFQLMINRQIGFWLTLLLLVLGPSFWGLKKGVKYFLSGLLIGGYLVFSLIQNKDDRHTIPLLPVVSIVVSYGLVKLAEQKQRVAISLLVLTVGLMGVYGLFLSFGIPRAWAESETAKLSIRLPYLGGLDLVNVSADIAQPPVTDSWPNTAIVQDVKAVVRNNFSQQNGINLLMVIDRKFLNGSNILLDLSLMGVKNVEIIAPFPPDRFPTHQDLRNYPQLAHLALVPTGEVGPFYIINKGELEYTRDLFLNRQLDNFTPVKEYVLPDNSKVVLYINLDRAENFQAEVVETDGFEIIPQTWRYIPAGYTCVGDVRDEKGPLYRDDDPRSALVVYFRVETRIEAPWGASCQKGFLLDELSVDLEAKFDRVDTQVYPAE